MNRNAINYQNTIIFKIIWNYLDIKDLYVGHTTDFTRRRSQHKYCCINSNYNGHHYKIYQTIRQNGGWENWSMIEIEKFNCTDANEATSRERYWFEKLQAKLNMVFLQQTKPEYFEANKDKIRDDNKQYRKTKKIK